MSWRSAAVGCLLGASAAAAQDTSPAAELARGDAAWEARRHAEALTAYAAVVRADSAFAPRALLRLGTLHAWAGRFVAALACQRLYVRLAPEDLDGRVALGRTLTWASRVGDALAQFDLVLARQPEHRDAVLGRAAALAAAGRFDEAERGLEQWSRAHPGDAEAEMGRARVLAWRGDLGAAEARWRAIITDHADDADAWVGLAQVLRWRGHAFAAQEALQRALTLNPASADAREQARWVAADVAPAAAVQFTHARDSERNVLDLVEVAATVARPRDARLTAIARVKRVAQPFAAVPSRTVPAAQLGLAWLPRAHRWSLRADLGVVDFTSVSVGGSALLGSARFGTPVGTHLVLGTGVSRTSYDDILSSADRALTLALAEMDAAWTFRPRVSVEASAGVGAVQGDGAANGRRSGSAALRLLPLRGIAVSASHREVRWERGAPGRYFAPTRFALTELSVRWAWPRDLGLVAAAELGAGAQLVRIAGAAPQRQFAPRTAMRLGWRPAPGREVSIGLQYADVASAGTSSVSGYRSASATLATRWTF